MVLFHRHFLTFLGISVKPVQTNSLLVNVGSKCFSTELQVIKRKSKFESLNSEDKEKNNDIDSSALFLLIIPATTFALGVWQIRRKFEKNEMIKNLKERSKTPPVEFPKDLNLLKDMEFRAVRVKGKFDHSKELYFGPRPIKDEKLYDASSLLSRSKGGYMIITPFTLTDRDLTILVNRGWVPAKKKLPESRKEGQITEEVELVGLVRLSEKRQPLSMKNYPEKNFWTYRDLEEMSKVTKAYPILIEADNSSSVPGGPIGGQTVITLKDDHVTYIITWFSLSLVTSWMWYNRYLRKTPSLHWSVF